MNRKRILVCGGAGFLGLNLCQHLIQQGHEVICVDNFSSSDPTHIDRLVKRHSRLSFLKHDVSLPLNLIKVDEIFNLACVASPVQYQLDPIQTIRTSTHGVLNLLELAVANNAKFFQASTSEVYGNPDIHPQPEAYFGNVNTTGPRACYDEGKRCAETLCFDFHRQYRTPVKVVRIFNTYGPYMQPNDGRVVTNFIVQALQSRPLTINGDGSQTRSFCYVDDMIRGFLALMETPDEFIGPVNLGNPEEFTVLELAERVLALTGAPSTIAFQELPQDDPVRRCPDIRFARKVLGWEPHFKLEQGLKRTIPYFRKLIQQRSVTARVETRKEYLYGNDTA
jgi:UDP-glucuronate decarboxylase